MSEWHFDANLHLEEGDRVEKIDALIAALVLIRDGGYQGRRYPGLTGWVSFHPHGSADCCEAVDHKCAVCGRSYRDDPRPGHHEIRRDYFIVASETYDDGSGQDADIRLCSPVCLEVWVAAHEAERDADSDPAGWLS